MNRTLRALSFAFFFLSLSAPALAEDLATGEPVPKGPVHPLTAEVELLRSQLSERLDTLNAKVHAALDAETALAVQREISTAKLDFELGVLELQLRHHDARGDKAITAELSASIEALHKVRAEVVGPSTDVPQEERATGEER